MPSTSGLEGRYLNNYNMDSKEGKGTLWDLKYEQGLPSLTIPDPFFVSSYGRLVEVRFPSGGRALDLAGVARPTRHMVGG